MYSTAYSSLSKLVPFLTILWYIESDEDFDKTKVFFMVACFNSMIQSTGYTFPLAVSTTGELLVSIRRVDVREKYHLFKFTITHELTINLVFTLYIIEISLFTRRDGHQGFKCKQSSK